MPSSSNKRIAKNTLFLYFRMLLIMGITFYTTRVVLECLGVRDYGIYNVVGGIVSLFSILSAALTSAIGRFIAFEIGRGDNERINSTFSTAVSILIILAGIFIIVMEPIGVWFLNSKMQIEQSRMNAANWVYQCSLITFAVSLISIPYNALIIAYEKMQAFAYISLLEASLKLGVASLLFVPIFDSLKAYAVMLCMVSVIIRVTYGRYATKHFNNITFRFFLDRKKFIEILSFTGWTCIGGSASILNNQGVNILLNLFFGTVINAARGIAMQIHTAIYSFSGNFMMSVNPQIIKSYAAGDIKRTNFLVFQGARISFFLLLMLSVPLIVETGTIIRFWLTEVPTETLVFTRIVLVQSLVDAMGLPLQTLNQASGKVKVYQIVAGGVLLLNFPISWLLLKTGMPPQSVFYVALAISIAGLLARTFTLQYLIGFNGSSFIYSVFIKGCGFGLCCFLLPIVIRYYVPELCGWCNILISAVWSFIIIILIGLNKGERQYIFDKVSDLYNKICRN